MRKILIVEDEEILRDTYKMVLSTEPYIVKEAADGARALELCQEIEFDLILLDLMMPRVDGVSFLKKSIELELKLPKVIIMSNLSSGEVLTNALGLGAYKNVVKADMTPRQLISMVRYELQAT